MAPACVLNSAGTAQSVYASCRASECTQPTMRDCAFAMSFLLKKSSGLTPVDGIDRPQKVALVAERHRGIDAHAALEIGVRGGSTASRPRSCRSAGMKVWPLRRPGSG